MVRPRLSWAPSVFGREELEGERPPVGEEVGDPGHGPEPGYRAVTDRPAFASALASRRAQRAGRRSWRLGRTNGGSTTTGPPVGHEEGADQRRTGAARPCHPDLGRDRVGDELQVQRADPVGSSTAGPRTVGAVRRPGTRTGAGRPAAARTSMAHPAPSDEGERRDSGRRPDGEDRATSARPPLQREPGRAVVPVEPGAVPADDAGRRCGIRRGLVGLASSRYGVPPNSRWSTSCWKPTKPRRSPWSTSRNRCSVRSACPVARQQPPHAEDHEARPAHQRRAPRLEPLQSAGQDPGPRRRGQDQGRHQVGQVAVGDEADRPGHQHPGPAAGQRQPPHPGARGGGGPRWTTPTTATRQSSGATAVIDDDRSTVS